MKARPKESFGQRLPEREWNFDECTNGDLRECFFYEYYREVPEAREWVKDWRNQASGTDFKAFEAFLDYGMKSLIDRFPEVPSVWFPIYPEWPEKPFLSVSCEGRLARRKRLDPEPNSNEAWTLSPSTKQTRANWQKGWAAIFDAFQDTKIWPLASTDEASACIAAFKIDWEYSNAQLMRAFDSWLNSHRPPEVAQEKSKVGGGSEIKKMRVDLKALGAYRQPLAGLFAG